MFMDATAFNQPLETWNTSKIKHTEGMFMDATAFNLNQQPPAWLMK